MKKSLATLTLTALALSAFAIPGIMKRSSANAESKLNTPQTAVAPDASFAAQDLAFATTDSGIVMPKAAIYALNSNNAIFVLQPGATSFTRLVRVDQANGNLIGIDFRPSDRRLYAVTDTGIVYTIALGAANLGNVTKVSNVSPRFDAGYQSLMDFNPVVDAVRLIGSDDSNLALVNSNGGNLNATAVQTSMSYPVGDVNAGKNPNVACGAYTNNKVGAQVTLFYAIDYALDTFLTIAPATPGASSATAGGQLQTIGNLVTPGGARVNISPTADFDIVTNADGSNSIVGVSGRTLFTIDLSQINTAQQRGQTKNVVVRGVTMPDTGGAFVDVAIRSF